GYKVSAMEPDSDGFDFASKVEGVDVQKIGIEDSLPDAWREQFDVAVSLEVVEHLFNPSALVNFAREALRPGGTLVLSTPYHGYWKNLALAVANKWDFHHHPWRVGGHIKFWSRNSLSRLLKDGGFVNSTFSGVGRFSYLWKSMILRSEKPAP
ncbi:MAG: class I SAM-dependent methyltransferase, partial [Verrucomicrobiota bacterium]